MIRNWLIKQTMEEIRIANMLLPVIKDFKNPVFPDGTIFAEYESRVPLALVPLPEGGAVCCAYDTEIPRPMPAHTIIKPGNESGKKRFFELFWEFHEKQG
jgi:hypothetical protein